MPRKPTGVIVSAVVLGLMSAFLLLGALGSVFSGLMFRANPSLVVTAPGTVAPPQGLLVGSILFAGVLYLGLSIWGIATVVGLVRMRSWARISIMVIGGCLAAFGLLGAAVSAMFPMLIRAQGQPMPPGTTTNMVSAAFYLVAAFGVLTACIGIWWLIYFLRRRTREAFAATAQSRIPAAPPADVTPFTDYTVAQPVIPAATTAQPNSWPAPPAETYDVQTIAPRLTEASSPASKRPVSMLVVGILLLLGSLMAGLQIISPLPLFFFGVTLYGMAAHVVIGLYALVAAYCGLGLIKLDRPAWFVTYAIFAVGTLNGLAMLLPGYRARMIAYVMSINQSMQSRLPQPPPGTPNFVLDSRLYSAMFIPGALLGIAMTIFLIVLLHRARWAFEPEPVLED